MYSRYFFVTCLFLCSLTSMAQISSDSIVSMRIRGQELVEKENYSEAFPLLYTYIHATPHPEKGSIDYSQAQKLYLSLRGRMAAVLKKIYDKATKFQARHMLHESDSLYNEYLKISLTPEFQNTYEYSVALTQRAMGLQKEGKIEDAIQTLKRVIEIRQALPDINRGHVGDALNFMASFEYQRGNYDKAIQICTDALAIYKSVYGEKHTCYGTTLNNLGSYYASRNLPGDRKKAVECGEKAVRILPKGKAAYAQALNSLVVYYSLTGEFSKAQKVKKEAMKISKKIGNSTLNYASTLSNQGVQLANVGNYVQAAAFTKEALTIFEENGETNSLNYARLLSNAASYQKHAENYEDAIALWQKAAPIYERVEGKSGTGYLDCMSEISAAMNRTGKTEQALDINEQLQAVASEQMNAGDSHYAHSLIKRATIQATEGNYQQAAQLQKQALTIFHQRQERNEEAKTLKDLSSSLFHTGSIKAAIDSCRKSLQIYESLKGYELDYALALNSIAIYYHYNNQEEEALAEGRKAIQLYEQVGDTASSFFAKILANVALYESSQNNFKLALTFNQRALKILSLVLGQEHPDNVMLKFNQAHYLLGDNKKLEAQHAFHEALTMQMQQVRRNFSHLSTRGRELFWGTKKYVFQAAPYMAYLLADNDSALVDAYNSQLFTKGLLLNSEIDFRNLLARTADSRLQETYNELNEIHLQIEDIWRSSDRDLAVQVPQLMKDANRLERQLIRDCKEYGDFTEAMNFTYQDVHNSLNETDAAIEFFDIDAEVGGKTYIALLVRKKWSVPQMIKLFCEEELATLSFAGNSIYEALKSQKGINAVYESCDLGKLVWKKLLPYLERVENVYFSPTGIFHQLGIEYLPLVDQPIGNQFTFHRLSSTKLLVQSPNNKNSLIKAVVFGGLDYDAPISELQESIGLMNNGPINYLAAFDADAQHDMMMSENRTISEFLREGRGNVGYLPGTMIEAEVIGECLMQQNVETLMYLSAQGTEECFKSLSGTQTPLIHIATHGFNISEDAVLKNQQAKVYLDVIQDESSLADNSLCFSGLLLAGANNILSGITLPKGMENGILTAKEIASLDLRGTDLVVLSACQTGLGELKEDGVFGLQRGFKKAGVRTLLMSLWSVDDKATQILMTNFYSALTEGKSRQTAFHTAQNKVRESGFPDPFYWASFVLLDD